MKGSFLSNKGQTIRLSLGLLGVISILAIVYFLMLPAKTVIAKNEPSQAAMTVFSNPAAIAPADRASNGAGTNPGIPPVAVYPSNIIVAGLSGTITKVTVTFSITSTFPDDFDIMLEGPTGARSLVMSDAGGSGDPVNVSYTWDQAAAGLMPDGPTTIVPTNTFQPSNYAGLATPEPGAQDNFPAPGPGLLSYPIGFGVFNGTNPNGTWKLYVVDDQQIDTMSLPGGWSIDITTAVAADAPQDLNGDGKSDYVVVRNVGGGSGGQIRWFYNTNGTAAPTVALDWGISTDQYLMEDFDGDQKDDVTVWRAVDTGGSKFYILQSLTNTVRIDTFGQSGDVAKVVGDYDGDGKADVAVYRSGLAAGDGSTWFYRGSLTLANINYVPWGQNGDFEAPGDYDGDGKNDFVIQRNNGGGQARFWRRFATGATDTVVFGTPTDNIAPGDYDGDGKTDIMVYRGIGGQLTWFYLSSLNGSINQFVYGISATDFSTQGDYDGDGKTDIAIWRPNLDPTQNFFYSLNSSNGATQIFELGQNGDYPVANWNRH